MKIITGLITFVTLIMSFSSCINDEFYSNDENGYKEGAYARTTVVIGHLNSDDAETRIKRLRLFVFDGSRLDTVIYKVFDSKVDSIIIEDLKVKAGQAKTFIAVANEPMSASEDYKKATSIQAVYGQTYNLADYLNNEDWSLDLENGCLPMFGEIVESVPFRNNQLVQEIKMKLERCVARLDVLMNKESDGFDAILEKSFFKLNLVNAASGGYLSRKQLDSEIISNKKIGIDEDITLGVDFKKIISLYVSEMHKENTSMKLGLEGVNIQGDLKSTSFVVGYEKGEINRNVYYAVNITARKASEPFDINMTVKEWTPVIVDGDILGTYLLLDKEEVVVEANSGGNVNVRTDAPIVHVDWSDAPYLNLFRDGIEGVDAADIKVENGKVDLLFRWQKLPPDEYKGKVTIKAGSIIRVLSVTKKDGSFIVFDITNMYIDGKPHDIPSSSEIIDIGMQAATFKFTVNTVVDWFIVDPHNVLEKKVDDKEGEFTVSAQTVSSNSKGYYVIPLYISVYYYSKAGPYRYYVGLLNRLSGYWGVGDYDVILGDGFNMGDYDNTATEVKCPAGWELPTIAQFNEMTGVTLDTDFQDMKVQTGFISAFPAGYSYWVQMDDNKTCVTIDGNSAKIEHNLPWAKLRCVRVHK